MCEDGRVPCLGGLGSCADAIERWDGGVLGVDGDASETVTACV